ncbi:MAG: flavohemoglobin expression-modulating QEGLA motif protein [Planctomycetota bacterium]|nr:flavohemoglobin expression-modulating QEGLA motif protein [Planctomycetota bacterium]
MVDDADVLAPLLALETELVEATKGLRILGAISWPRGPVEEFLAGWRVGSPRIPQVTISPPEGLAAVLQATDAVLARAPRDHPLGDLIWKTAWSYHTAARMLDSMGTLAFTERSIELYGRPDKNRTRQNWSDLDAAEFLLEKSAGLLSSAVIDDVNPDMSAEDLAARMRALIDPIFVDDPIEVVIAPDLVSKASAASTRVRLREDARFSLLDLDQLFEHEVMVHSATMISGKRQPHLQILGLGSPRTTRHQEGLATFAEIATGSMDLARLRRIALRVRAVSIALNGGDFLDVFKMFLGEGQSEEESAQSAMRVFRGGDPRGGAVFTKDGTYIAGLFEVDMFLRVAARDNRPELIHRLFSGRLTLGDTVALSPLYDSGLIVGPRYVPTWASDLRRLTATMTYSAFVNLVDLDNLVLEDAVRFDDRAYDAWSSVED